MQHSTVPHRVMMLMVVMGVVLVGDEGEERLQQVEEVDPSQHQQHLVDVVGRFLVVVVLVAAAFTAVNVQPQELDSRSWNRQINHILVPLLIKWNAVRELRRGGVGAPYHGQQVQQSVPAQRAHGQTDAELDAQLEDAGAGGAQQDHDAKHGGERDDHVGQGRVQVPCRDAKSETFDL